MANIPHTILLVDDSESDRAICRRYLLANENYDYQILEAETLEEGLDQLKVGSPDAVLVDLNLPDGSGLELLEAIRKTYPGQNFPVIMMTSQGDEQLAVQSMKLGASDYLFKDDMTASTLCHYVETAIAQWNLSGKLTELQQFNQELQALQTRLEESTQELQTSEAFNRSILAAIPDLLLHLGRDGTCLNYIEPKVGKDRFQVIANHIAEFLPPDLLARQLQSIEQALVTRELQVYEHQVLKNGQPAYEEIRILAIGEQTVLAIVRDISDRKQMELNLQQSEKMNRIILETLPDLLIHMDLQGNYVRKSQGQNVRVLGLKDTSVELNIHNILPRHLVEQRLYFANLAIESGTLQICEQIIDFPEEQRFEEIRIAPLNEQEVLVIIRDVSDRKQVEKTLLESQQFLQTVLDALPLAVFWKNRESVMLGCNQFFAKISELDSPQEAVGKTNFDFSYTEAQAQGYLLDDQQVMASGIGLVGIEETITLPTGEIRWIETDKVPLRDLEGHVVGILGTFQDITERVENRQTLLDLTDRLTIALNSGAIGCWEWEIVNNAATWDERIYELYGIPVGTTVLFETWANTLHPDDRQATLTLFQETIAGKSEYDTEFRVIHPDGSIYFLKSYGAVVRDDWGNVLKIIGVNFDITEQKQAEAEIQQKNLELAELLQLREETLTMREDMSNMIVHDLRNPLSAMILGAGIVQKYINRADRMPFILKTLDKIQTSGQQINKMIDSLLLMAKLESGKIIFNPVPTDLYELGMDVIKDFELIANSCQIKLQSELPSVGNSVLIDPTILHRIIDNLLSNALKFSPPHSQVTLSLEYLPENHLKIKVADMGLGISDSEKRKIFGKFEVGSLKKNTSQTGLGLAFCKMAVDAQGGTIRVVDNYPQGVIFIIEI